MKYFTDLVENKSLISEDIHTGLSFEKYSKMAKKTHQEPENSGIERH